MSLKEIVRESTDLIERLCIEAALAYTADNRASAAEILGLSRQSLYSKLHRHGLGNLSRGRRMTRDRRPPRRPAPAPAAVLDADEAGDVVSADVGVHVRRRVVGSRRSATAGRSCIAGIALTGPLVCGTSQAVNDWFDRHVDAINQPERPIPSGRIPGRWGLGLAIVGNDAVGGGRRRAHRTVGVRSRRSSVSPSGWAYSAPPLRLKMSGICRTGGVRPRAMKA